MKKKTERSYIQKTGFNQGTQSPRVKIVIVGIQENNLNLRISGNSTVGKSCLLLRYSKDEYSDDQQTTYGIEFFIQKVQKPEFKMQLQIFDTCGQERFGAVSKIFYNGAVGALVVFDITNKESFDQVPAWLDKLKENAFEEISMILIGNKCDLHKDRKVDYQQAADFAQNNNMFYIEASAKTDVNVKKSFQTLINRIYEDLKESMSIRPIVDDKRTTQVFRQTIGNLDKPPDDRPNNTSKITCNCK